MSLFYLILEKIAKFFFADVVVFRDDKGETNIEYGALGNFSISGCWVHLSRDSSSYIASFYFPTGSYLSNRLEVDRD